MDQIVGADAVLRHETHDRGGPRDLSTARRRRDLLSRRVLLLPRGEAAARSAIDWIATHQPGHEVMIAGWETDRRPIGRLDHPPFRPSPAGESAIAAAAGLLLADAPATRRAPPRGPAGATAGGAPVPAAVVVEAAALALLVDAPLAVAAADAFPALVPVSAWSMNLPSRPPDGPLARHLDIAAHAVSQLRTLAAPALEALRSGDPARIEAALRARRRAARADGPVRFRRLGGRSAGLRPIVLYIDLLPALAAAAVPARDWLAGLEPGPANALLGMSIALFL